MRKLLTVMALAGAMCLPSVVFADASWYGSLRGGVEVGGGNDASFKDGGSRWGIKGSSEISEGLSAVYRFEHKISTENASQPGGRLAYAGLSGAFGTVSLGQVWSASFNHVGGITDGSWFYGNSETSYRVGNALSYAMSAGAVSLQLDAIMDGGKDTGESVDQLEFGMSIDLGDIGKVGLAYVDTKDVNITTDPVVVIPEAKLDGSAPSYTLGGSAPTYSLTRGDPIPMPAFAGADDEAFNLDINDDGEVVVSSKTKWYDAASGDDRSEVDATVTWKAGDDSAIVDADRGVTTRIIYVDEDESTINTSYLDGAGIDSKGRQTTGGADCVTTPADCKAIAVFAIDITPANNIVTKDGVIVGYTGNGQVFKHVAPDDPGEFVVLTQEYDTPGEITGVAQKAGTGYTGVTRNANTGYTSSFGAYTGTYRVDEKGKYVMTHKKGADDKYVAKYVDDLDKTHLMKDGKYVEATGDEKATHYAVMDAEGKADYTNTMHSRTYMSAPGKDVVKGSRATHIAAQFNLGAVTAYLGYSQSEENGASMKDKTTHYGVSGDLGDTGMSFHVMARNKDNANGMDTNPWLVGLTKGLGGGATVMVEHGNDDDGESGKTRFGLKVDF